MSLDYRSPAEDEFRAAVETNSAAFGEEIHDDDFPRFRAWMPLDRMLSAWDGGRPVGLTASYPFELTVPGGTIAAAGVTWVGVLPTHRRRGVLRELMRRQLDDVRERGEPVAILWASEARIYGRYGYGVATRNVRMHAERGAFALRDDAGARGRVRLVDADEAFERFPPLYERVRAGRAGMLSRTEEWWRLAKLADAEHWREGASRKYFALLDLDGEPAGYAIYRVASKWSEDGTPNGEVRVHEAFGLTPAATAELWRFIFGIDLVVRVRADGADPATPLFLMVEDTRRLHLSWNDGIWLRLLDLEAALRARDLRAGEPVVLEVRDDRFPANAGRWALASDGPSRTDGDADVEIDVRDLASAYLGAFSFEELAVAGRARQFRPGGLAKASALFAAPLAPWCPEEF